MFAECNLEKKKEAKAKSKKQKKRPMFLQLTLKGTNAVPDSYANGAAGRATCQVVSWSLARIPEYPEVTMCFIMSLETNALALRRQALAFRGDVNTCSALFHSNYFQFAPHGLKEQTRDRFTELQNLCRFSPQHT